MINIPNDFQTAKAYDGNSDLIQLTPGGHICKVLKAYTTKSKNNNDMLVLEFDIQEGSEFDGYFQHLQDARTFYNPDAAWLGTFRTTITNAKGNCSSYFKGVINALEESNRNYNFLNSRGDERQMIGKWIGFVFREEDYIDANGKQRTSTKPFYAVSAQRVKQNDIEVPAKKELNQNAGAPAINGTFAEVDNNDELPF